MIAKLQQFRWYQHVLKLKDFFPAIAFFGGFIWDALTIGRSVQASDLWILSAYLIAAIPIIWWLAKKESLATDTGALASNESAPLPSSIQPSAEDMHWKTRLPYMAIQFLFGSLFSALFILYFKSASHLTAIVWSIGMGALLVANEFLESAYKRFTLTWTLFGFCAMLLCNFALPFLLGSIHPMWFYLSTLLGVGATHWIYKNMPNHFGSIRPVWLIAAMLMVAYAVDIIPPVPLVKRDIAMAYELTKVDGNYQLVQQPSAKWVFWRKTSDDLEVATGQRVYCISSVFAPSGLSTRLYHRWQFYDKKQGWQTKSYIGFTLDGGRYNGFRGYTYKQNLQAGDWRVAIETENQKTVAIYDFSVKDVPVPTPHITQLF